MESQPQNNPENSFNDDNVKGAALPVVLFV